MCEYDSRLVKLIADDTPKALFGLLIVSSIFLWTYWEYIPFEYLLVWTLFQVLFLFLRFFNSKMLLKYIENETKLRFHTIFLVVIIVYSAIVWSSATLLGAYFAPSPYEFISLAMIMGIITAAVLSLTPLVNIFIIYFFIMILIQFGVMLYFGTNAHISIALFLLIFMPVIILLSKSVYKNLLVTVEVQDKLETHVNELREISITDSLTKVFNRHYFFQAAQDLLSIAKREKTPVSFLMIDIDYFKNINDTYGHQVGDHVLIKLSEEIKNVTRESDIFARIGGEEFALFLHNTSIEGAKNIAEKIRITVEDIDFSEKYIPSGLTVSIGVATTDGVDICLEELYHAADQKLYVAKELGRNRVQ